MLIDTAGLQKKSKIRKSGAVEFFSSVRTYKAIRRCDVAILMIDAMLIMEQLEEVSDPRLSIFRLDKQDITIIEDVTQLRKGLLVVINKWDLVEKDHKTAEIVEQKIKEHLKTFRFLRIIFVSALTKQRIHKVLETAKEIYEERKKIIKTSKLNEELQIDIQRIPHPSIRGRELKINYITQLKSAPPIFAFFCNDPGKVRDNYKRYLEKRIRERFGFEGVPVGIVFKKKN